MGRLEERVGAVVVNSDYYATLGVSPGADHIVIRAAYRALIRHYHPDSNPDPEAQARARAVTEAYAVLRDPAKRAEYDADLKDKAGEEWWSFEERTRPATQPPMRGAGMLMAAAAVAIVTVGLAWTGPQKNQPAPATHAASPARQKSKRLSAVSQLELQPERERLADLGASVRPPLPLPTEQVPAEPRSEPVDVLRNMAPPPPPRPARTPAPRPVVMAQAAAAPARTPSASVKPVAASSPPPAANKGRLATLQRVSASFYNQAMLHADAEKKAMLIGAHSRLVTRQGACRSDSCVADTYLREIRETSAIMENRALPQQ
jgi:hypothetical protein